MNATTVKGQERAYRRGLVLGLTLAEIMMLILFIMLLLLASVAHRSGSSDQNVPVADRNKVDQLSADLSQANQRIRDLDDQLAAAKEEASSAQTMLARREQDVVRSQAKVDDLFAELERTRSDLSSVNKAMAKMTVRSAATKTELDALREHVARLEQGSANTTPESASVDTEALAAHDTLAEALSASKSSPNHNAAIEVIERVADEVAEWPKPVDPTEVIQALKKNSQQTDTATLHVENADLRRQIEDLRRQMKWVQDNVGGKGVEMPSCWIDERGRVEYIFDVILGPTGFVIHETNLPRRAIDRQNLPMSGIALDRWVDPNSFLSMTSPIFNWSVANNCRFFVRVFDDTPPDNKQLYKQRLQTAEQHFYKLLVGN